MDVLLRAVRDEIVLRKERVCLDLVDRLRTRPAKHRDGTTLDTTHRNDTSGINDALNVSNGKV